MKLLLGADSLAGRRSGIGQVTFEVGCAMRGHPGISGMRLVVGGRVTGTGVLDAPADPAARSAMPDAQGRRRTLRSFAARVPALRTLQQRAVCMVLDRAARGLARNGAPVLYYEPNMVAKPFSGPTVVAVNDMSWHCRTGYHPADRVRWIERNLPATLRQASRFVAISAFTKAELWMCRPCDRERQALPRWPGRTEPGIVAATMEREGLT